MMIKNKTLGAKVLKDRGKETFFQKVSFPHKK